MMWRRRAVRCMGIRERAQRVPSAVELANARARSGSQHLDLDPERRTVAFDRGGVRINLGSIGKGFAIDRAVDVLRAHWWPVSALVHGGQSSLYALGSPPGRFGDRWEVALRNPFKPESPLGTLRLRNRGLDLRARRFNSLWPMVGCTGTSSTRDRESRPRDPRA